MMSATLPEADSNSGASVGLSSENAGNTQRPMKRDDASVATG